MTPEDRAAAIGAQFPVNGITYTFAGIVFAVSGCVVSGSAVGLSLTAWTGTGRNRVNLPVGTYDRVINGLPCNFVFVNPVLGVADGGTQVITPPHGAPYTVPTFSRSDLAAAQQIVHAAVTACARALGWAG